MQQDFAIMGKSTACFWIGEKLEQVYRKITEAITAWGPPRWELSETSFSFGKCRFLKNTLPTWPGHTFLLKWYDAGFGLVFQDKINQWLGDTFQEISASGVGPAQPTALHTNLTESLPPRCTEASVPFQAINWNVFDAGADLSFFVPFLVTLLH